jgi:hypothetical protein
MKSYAITPFIGSKWTLNATYSYSNYDEKYRYTYSISDGWHIDYPIVYDNWLVVYEYPEKLPKYVKKFIQKTIWGKDWIHLYNSETKNKF